MRSLRLFRAEKCEFLPFMSPLSVITRPDTGRISHLVLARNEQVRKGDLIY